jgi:hypothetical protein
MSLVVSVYTREGIVMAADSRLTLTFPRTIPGQAPHTVSVTSSDSARKLFLTPNRIGVSAFGAAAINGAPIGGVIESFIVEKLKDQDLPPKETADALLAYFTGMGVSQPSSFHVAGYRSDRSAGMFTQEAVFLDLAAKAVTAMNTPGRQGANWGGEIDVFQRLMNDVQLVGAPEAAPIPIPSFVVPFEWFTLQDAIDFANFAIRATIDTMRFQAREKTVGGPVDILVITPDNAHWIAQKQLRS